MLVFKLLEGRSVNERPFLFLGTYFCFTENNESNHKKEQD